MGKRTGSRDAASQAGAARHRAAGGRSREAAKADFHPLKRLGTPEDVTSAAPFLASADASWITGLILDVTGDVVRI